MGVAPVALVVPEVVQHPGGAEQGSCFADRHRRSTDTDEHTEALTVPLVPYRVRLGVVRGAVTSSVSQPESQDLPHHFIAPGYPMEVVPVCYPLGRILVGTVPKKGVTATSIVNENNCHAAKVSQGLSTSSNTIPAHQSPVVFQPSLVKPGCPGSGYQLAVRVIPLHMPGTRPRYNPARFNRFPEDIPYVPGYLRMPR